LEEELMYEATDTVRIGTKTSIERRMCPDALRIGTKTGTERKDLSRYRENRDKNQHRKKGCVPIP